MFAFQMFAKGSVFLTTNYLVRTQVFFWRAQNIMPHPLNYPVAYKCIIHSIVLTALTTTRTNGSCLVDTETQRSAGCPLGGDAWKPFSGCCNHVVATYNSHLGSLVTHLGGNSQVSCFLTAITTSTKIGITSAIDTSCRVLQEVSALGFRKALRIK